MSAPMLSPGTAEGLEDLDALAQQYAHDYATATGPRVRRLRDEMIRMGLPCAGRLARRFRHSGEPMADLEQVARLGLVKAVDRYAPEKGSFTAYAITTILGELKRHLRDNTWSVHAPRRMQELVLEIGRHQAPLAQELGRRPTDRELAERCGTTVAQVAEARRCGAGYRSASLNMPVGDGTGELGDLFGAADASLERVADEVTVSHLISRLPARERRILTLRFFGNQSQADIAAQLGMSQMHVSRLLARTLAWLREGLLTDAVPRWSYGDPADAAVDLDTSVLPGGDLQIRIAGELDRDNAGRLRAGLLELISQQPSGRRVSLDLSEVPLVDAAVVGVLLAVHEAARVRGVLVRATGLQPLVRQIAVATGLSALLTPAKA